MTMKAINPSTGKLIREYEEMTAEEVRRGIESAHHAFLAWRKAGFAKRAEALTRAARILRDNAQGYATLMAEEMGKPVKEGREEIEKCTLVSEYFATHAEKFLQEEIIETDASKSYICFQPLGVILAVMPWNFPFWQVFRFAAPTLMAGNAIVMKPASNVPACGLAVEDLFRNAGFPKGLFRTLLISGSRVNAVIEHDLVKAATLTGSTAAGREVAKKAGGLLKKTVLELGGSDPYVILEDAELEKAVTTCVASRLLNSGQRCNAAKRFIIIDSIRDRVEDLFVEHMRAKTMGDPRNGETDIGPMARHDLRDSLHRQVQESIAKGATCLLGGAIPEGRGAFYPPTVLTNVKKGMPAFDEELFGPVAALIGVKNEEEAIRVANDTVFGLGAAVFTNDVARGERIARDELEAGSCFVNTFVRSDPRLPFGGIRESGYGRELSPYGIKEFVNIKTVYVK